MLPNSFGHEQSLKFNWFSETLTMSIHQTIHQAVSELWNLQGSNCSKTEVWSSVIILLFDSSTQSKWSSPQMKKLTIKNSFRNDKSSTFRKKKIQHENDSNVSNSARLSVHIVYRFFSSNEFAVTEQINLGSVHSSPPGVKLVKHFPSKLSNLVPAENSVHLKFWEVQTDLTNVGHNECQSPVFKALKAEKFRQLHSIDSSKCSLREVQMRVQKCCVDSSLLMI